ncbi:MAG TPA: hypothetical protein VHC19_19460 [Pirellulales bacterium]|nr:hypothetical protein [Pirellulales bacterium]
MNIQCVCIAGMLCLALSGTAAAQSGSWRQLGRAGEWKGTLAAAVLNDWIYTVDDKGGLYRTHPHTGQRTPLGKLDFANARFLFALGGSLYAIETDGTLYRVSAGNGARQQVGRSGDWSNAVAGAAWPFDARDGMLLTVESDGGLYSTRPADGSRVRVGISQFRNVRFMFMANALLYTVESDGTLYEVDPVMGRRQMVGSAGDWRGAIAGASLNGRIYTAESHGDLFETDPATGERTLLSKSQYGGAASLLAAAGGLFAIGGDGSLYRIEPPVASPSAPANPARPAPRVTSQSTMNITPLGDDRFRAEISYLDSQGVMRTGSTEGTREEIRAWLNGLSGLPAATLNNYLRAVEQAGRRRLPPRRAPFPRSPRQPMGQP